MQSEGSHGIARRAAPGGEVIRCRRPGRTDSPYVPDAIFPRIRARRPDTAQVRASARVRHEARVRNTLKDRNVTPIATRMTYPLTRTIGLVSVIVMVLITASLPARGLWWCEEDQEAHALCCCVSWTVGDSVGFAAIQPSCCNLISLASAALVTANEPSTKVTPSSIMRRPCDRAQRPRGHPGALLFARWNQLRTSSPPRALYLQYCSLQI